MKDALMRFEAYLRRRYPDRSTAKHYVSDVRIFAQHIAWAAPSTVTAQTIDAFVAAQQAQKLKPRTVNRRLATLHTFFEFLALDSPEDAPPNPVNWRRHGVKEAETLPRDLSEAQVTQLFAAITDPRDQALFELMLTTGLRVGEVVALRLDDLEPPPTPEEVARLRVCGKGRKERCAWVTPRLYASLQKWLAVRPNSAHAALFLNQHGRPLSISGVEYCLKQYARTAGLSVSCHQLRHTFARRLLEHGLTLEVLSHLMGHAQVTTTQIYTAGADLSVREAFLRAMQRLEDAATLPLPAPEPVPPAPPAVPVAPADLAALDASYTHFAAFPAWLRDSLEAYVAYRWRNWQPHLAPQHADRLARALHRTWAWLLDHAALQSWSDLRRVHLETWLTARQAAGLQVSSQINQLNTVLRHLHFVADHQGYALPADLWRIPYPQRPEALPRHLSEEEYQRLIQTVLEHTAPGSAERAWFFTLAHTGVRVSELLHLQRADVDLGNGRLVIRGGKGARDRVVYLTSVAAQALAAHICALPPDAVWLWGEGDQRMTDQHVRYRLRRWGAACAVQVSPHRLRHTFATRLLNGGMPLDTIRRLLGHRTLSMTQRYAHLHDATAQRQFQEAMRQLEGIAVSNWPQPIQTDKVLVSTQTDSV
jgi:site-specific recombinase XerD